MRVLRSASAAPAAIRPASLTFNNDFTRQASDTGQVTPNNLGLSLAAFMLGIPTSSSATIQPTSKVGNNFFAAYAQDTWRFENLTVNLGLRYEWENGPREDRTTR